MGRLGRGMRELPAAAIADFAGRQAARPPSMVGFDALMAAVPAGGSLDDLVAPNIANYNSARWIANVSKLGGGGNGGHWASYQWEVPEQDWCLLARRLEDLGAATSRRCTPRVQCQFKERQASGQGVVK